MQLGRINSIQYMRAIAAILVVGFHSSIQATAYLSDGVLEFIKAGAVGVDIFFVISGFIMYTINASSPQLPGDFLKKRFIRIVPLYWIATAIVVLAAYLKVTAWVPLTVGNVVKSFLFIPHYQVNHPGEIYPVLIPGWTLNYEMFFYLIFALAILLRRNRVGTFVATVLLGLFLLGRLSTSDNPLVVTYTNPLLLEFLAGVLIGAHWNRSRTLSPILGAGIALLCAACIVLWAEAAQTDDMTRLMFWGIPSAVLVFCGLHTRAMSATNRLLLLVGEASYAIYIFHTIALTVMAAIWKRLPVPHGGVLFEGITVTAVYVVLSCMLGVAIHLAVERPLDRYLRGRLFARHRRDQAVGLEAR